jgi:hypothetical protein
MNCIGPVELLGGGRNYQQTRYRQSPYAHLFLTVVLHRPNKGTVMQKELADDR